MLTDPVFGAVPIDFAYNAMGLRTNMVDASGSTRYEYDVRNRLRNKVMIWATIGLSVALSYLYDANGSVTNLASSSVNGGKNSV